MSHTERYEWNTDSRSYWRQVPPDHAWYKQRDYTRLSCPLQRQTLLPAPLQVAVHSHTRTCTRTLNRLVTLKLEIDKDSDYMSLPQVLCGVHSAPKTLEPQGLKHLPISYTVFDRIFNDCIYCITSQPAALLSIATVTATLHCHRYPQRRAWTTRSNLDSRITGVRCKSLCNP
jgi:hypothetical protein